MTNDTEVLLGKALELAELSFFFVSLFILIGG